MANQTDFEIIIVGGSYAGLSAAMALGRSLRKVLVIDGGKPCNEQTPHSHNFITQDGQTPSDISALAKIQVEKYPTVTFFDGRAISGKKIDEVFEITAASGEHFTGKKLIFATGVKDQMLPIPGFSESWGISVIHCPYCHGYEVKGQKTGVLGNGDYGFEFSKMINNWTKDLTLFTNGPSTLTPEQTAKLLEHNIKIVEQEVIQIKHTDGKIEHIALEDHSTITLSAIYSKTPFVQHSDIPTALGCQLNEDGYIEVDHMQQTTIPGIYACGDNTTFMRSVANAVAMGNKAGSVANRELINETF